MCSKKATTELHKLIFEENGGRAEKLRNFPGFRCTQIFDELKQFDYNNANFKNVN